MKKILCLCLIFLFIPRSVFCGEITVELPNNKTKWIWNSTEKIKWHDTNVSGRTKITLWRLQEYIGVIADNIIPPPPQVKSTERSYSWRVGDYDGGSVEPKHYYWIKIEQSGRRAIAESEKYFEIVKRKKLAFAKARFWDLKLNFITVNDKKFVLGKPANRVIYVKLGEPVIIRAYISQIPLHKSKVRPVDVSKWGNGEWEFPTTVMINAPMGINEQVWWTLPKFSYIDVNNWGSGFQWGMPGGGLYWKWIPRTDLLKNQLGKKFRVAVWVDSLGGKIPETDESNNNNPNAPFIVFYDKILPFYKNMNLKPIVIKSPISQPKWLLGSKVKIKWIATGVSYRMKITLWRAGLFLGVIADNIFPPPPFVKSKSYSYDWRVGDYIGGTAKPHLHFSIGIETKGSLGEKIMSRSDRFEIRELKVKKAVLLLPKRAPGISTNKSVFTVPAAVKLTLKADSKFKVRYILEQKVGSRYRKVKTLRSLKFNVKIPGHYRVKVNYDVGKSESFAYFKVKPKIEKKIKKQPMKKIKPTTPKVPIVPKRRAIKIK